MARAACLLYPESSQGRGWVAAGWFCCHHEQDSVTSAKSHPRLSCTYCVLQALMHSCSRRFLSTYYVLGTTDAKQAIHSFIHFFLLSFDKSLSEQRRF